MTDTIFALSSGAPPAAIAVIRISGPAARSALKTLTGNPPPERKPSLRTLRDSNGEVLDQSLVIWFCGPHTATGEDLVELHCHGGRAVVLAVTEALGRMKGLREALPGEFTRRAFSMGRIDLAEAQGLADLLSAETEWQRRQALFSANGSLSRRIEEWRSIVLQLGAAIEAVLDFGDEDDVADLPPGFTRDVENLANEMVAITARPSVDRLRAGVRVVLAGPPNSGKSSLFNYLVDEGVAIVSEEAGTTRDVIERPVALGGVPYVLVDTAGIRENHSGSIEAIGIEKARAQIGDADILLWLGDESDAPTGSIVVQSKADLGSTKPTGAHHIVSSVTGQGVEGLVSQLEADAREILPLPDQIAFSRAQKRMVSEATDALFRAAKAGHLLVVGEELRRARVSFDMLLGRNSTEQMLDALFGRFCIGK